MTDKTKKIILVIIALVLIASVVKIIFTPQKTYNKISLDKTNLVLNVTNDDYLDTIVKVGLKELKLTNIFIKIIPLSQKQIDNFSSNGELKASIKGSYNSYFLYIVKLNRHMAIKAISHELIHLIQYRDKRLEITNTSVLWEGKVIDFNSLTYEERPWEIEAFREQIELENKINSILFE